MCLENRIIMKILYLTTDLVGNNGWSRCSVDLITAMQEQGHVVSCVVATTAARAVDQHVLLGQPLNYLVNPWRAYKTAREVQKVVDQFRPDLIHVMVEPYGHIVPFLRTHSAKTCLTINGTYGYIPSVIHNPVKKVIAWWLSTILLRSVNRVICISNFTNSHFIRHAPAWLTAIVHAKMIIITPGIRLERYPTFTEKKAGGAIKQIIFVGAVKSRKGVHAAIEALRIYRDRHGGNFYYTIIGTYEEGSGYIQELRSKIKDYGLENQVSLVGHRTERELFDAYQNADLFLMLSINSDKSLEGFGLVYLEASAFGVPSIGSRDSGAQEAINDGSTGFVVDSCDAGLTADKIHAIIDQHAIDPQTCRQWAESHTVVQMAQKTLAAYQSC